jgi:hypothetical protein
MIAEPMTVLTDYVLAGVCAALGFLLVTYREQQRSRQRSRSLWAAAFFALALTALLGGTFHGFRNVLLWKSTLLAAGLVSFLMVSGSAYAATHGMVRKAIIAAACIKLLAYEAWMLGHDAFVWVIADTGSALALVAALHLRSRWMVAGVAVSVLAAAVQASGLDVHRYFNHNDLYHVIQIVAMILLYRGARTLQDFSAATARR